MRLTTIVLAAGLATGFGACATEQESPWGRSSGINFKHHEPPSYDIQVQEFERAMLSYLKDSSDRSICAATVVYKDNPAMTLNSIEDFYAEMKKELPLGPVRIMFDRGNLGYVIVDIGCDGVAESYVINSPGDMQSILARDRDPKMFEERFDPMLGLIKQKTESTNAKAKPNGLSNELMRFINNMLF